MQITPDEFKVIATRPSADAGEFGILRLDKQPLPCGQNECLPLQASCKVIQFVQYEGLTQEAATQCFDLRKNTAMNAHVSCDELTGLPLRAKLFDWEQNQRDPAARYLLTAIDVRNLGMFNNYASYEAGDDLMRDFAEYIRDAVRSEQQPYGVTGDRRTTNAPAKNTDMVYRWGGDEFVVITKATGDVAKDAKTLETISDRIKNVSKTVNFASPINRVLYNLQTGTIKNQITATARCASAVIEPGQHMSTVLKEVFEGIGKEKKKEKLKRSATHFGVAAVAVAAVVGRKNLA